MKKAKIKRGGVQQASKLGTMLFLMYIKDLSNYFSSDRAILQADDLNIFVFGGCVSYKDIENQIQETLIKLNICMDDKK